MGLYICVLPLIGGSAPVVAVGGAAGLQVVAALSPGWGLGTTLWLTAGLAVVGSVALLALPETRGLPLSE